MRSKFESVIGCAALVATAVAASCSRFREQSKPAVRAAIEEHLAQQPGLQMQNMTMQMQDVKFQGDSAEAQVKYLSKESPDIYVQIRYELHKQGGRWQVQASSLVGGMPATPHEGAPSRGPGAASSPADPAAVPGRAPTTPHPSH
jgi:hypothetical protein